MEMETTQLTGSLQAALENDTRSKAWIAPNQPLFANSGEYSHMFLTTYRIRNAYEDLLNRLETHGTVEDEEDKILVMRWFEMMFYPPKKLNLTQWKAGVDPTVRIVRAFKDRRWRANGKRPFEISLLLDDGKTVQINPNDVLNKYMTLRREFVALESSNL
jgi:hypothetical protein